MIAALFALAAAMIIGGAAAVVQGFPYVRMESGLALVIAGSVAASSGAVLLGLGVVALGLRRLERAGRLPLAQAPDTAEPPADGGTRLPPVLPPAPAFVLPPVVAPPAFEVPPVEPPHASERPRIEPALHAVEPPPAGPVPAEPELPMPGLTPPAPAPEPPAEPEPEQSAEPVRGLAPEDDLFAAPEPELAPHRSVPEELSLRPSLAAAETPAPDAAPKPAPERTVVGRYSSGANTYVMFEDGSIEADTPQGSFTFGSLDELKAFVENGETRERGAA